MIKLGSTVTEVITGVKGVVTGRCEYLTGCNQYLVQPKSRKGQYVESHWFDEAKLRVEKDKPVVLPATKGPGFDKEAPRR